MTVREDRNVRHLTVMAALVLAAARVAEAHPGHGAGGDAWAVQHYVSEPVHAGAVALMAALAAAVLAWRFRAGRPAAARRAPQVL
jgi:hypothetical protein